MAWATDPEGRRWSIERRMARIGGDPSTAAAAPDVTLVLVALVALVLPWVGTWLVEASAPGHTTIRWRIRGRRRSQRAVGLVARAIERGEYDAEVYGWRPPSIPRS